MELILLISLILGATGALIIIYFGRILGLLDSPSARSSHRVPTPKGGGIGILAAFLFVCIYQNISVFFWFPVMIVSLFGLYADRTDLHPKIRLLVQFSAAFIFILGMQITEAKLIWKIVLAPLWAIFIVGTANFYNFMDGINGIAGITGVNAFGLTALFVYLNDLTFDYFFISVTIALACVGFLPFNMPGAKVFLGDVGSIFLGFLFACVVSALSNDIPDFVCLSSFIFLFYADELTTELVRLKDGEKLWVPHRRHLYQLLANEYNIDHWKVSLGYGIAQLLIGISILMARKKGILTVALIIFLYFVIFTMISNALRIRLVRKSSF